MIYAFLTAKCLHNSAGELELPGARNDGIHPLTKRLLCERAPTFESLLIFTQVLTGMDTVRNARLMQKLTTIDDRAGAQRAKLGDICKAVGAVESSGQVPI